MTGRTFACNDPLQGPISHVWADGMGSTTEDGLPMCVIKWISGLITTLLPDTDVFWMDSLSHPCCGRAAEARDQTHGSNVLGSREGARCRRVHPRQMFKARLLDAQLAMDCRVRLCAASVDAPGGASSRVSCALSSSRVL
ncbi:hypothetical protein C8Q79DRAFT_20646 [Trametes meyenii]|nr:hypothetical protein C8Q79DRAFT_20646 [Trametes meyenii]